MPVPSTMMGFMETTVLMLWGLVVLTTNFIMTRGPMAMTSSKFAPAWIFSSSGAVTTPFCP